MQSNSGKIGYFNSNESGTIVLHYEQEVWMICVKPAFCIYFLINRITLCRKIHSYIALNIIFVDFDYLYINLHVG